MESISFLLKKIVPKRPYALRTSPPQSPTSTITKRQLPPEPSEIHTFSEGKIVFSRLASNLWPGTATIYLLYSAKDETNLDEHVKYLATEDGYLCFRSPSHPLALKALKLSSKDANFMVLLGRPMLQVTAADQVPPHADHVSAVMNGEERRETFCVPTCEHGNDQPSLFIDTRKRTITIRNGKQSLTTLSRAQVVSYLQRRNRRSSLVPPSSPSSQSCELSKREKLVEAVLGRWKVEHFDQKGNA